VERIVTLSVPSRPLLTEAASLIPTGISGNVGFDNEVWWSSALRGDELDAAEFPPLEFLVNGVLVAGSLTLLAGPPKAGKSMLALDLALAVAGGAKALGALPVSRSGEVLLVSLDDQSQARQQRRIRSILRGEPIPTAFTLHTEPNLGRGSRAAAALGEYLDANPSTVLVVVDTLEHLRGLTSPGESAYSADVRMLSELRRVVAAHPTVTLLALVHTRKTSGEADDAISAVSGTHGVTGGADAVLVLTGQRGAPMRALDVVSRDGEDRRLVVRWTTDGGLALADDDPDDPAVTLTPDDARVYRAVADMGCQVSASDLNHLGMPKVGNRLLSLSQRGFLTKTGRGSYRA
jgi:hypothetical protein